MKFTKNLAAVFGFALVSVASANMDVTIIDVSRLPYELSTKKFENSPSNFNNSSSNFNNSASNFNNSKSNFINSASNFANSPNGKQKLMLNGKFVGYHVLNSSGLTNFFSASGERVFYNPDSSAGVFTPNGKFVGVVALASGNQITLALSSEGVRTLLSR